ncbi:MAG: DUF4824 family protein [Acidobacteriia bacterium]|nr:DUF4824 family protein [Terriglobia bacterium]
MRRWGPFLAIAWVLLSSAIALLGVARNRAGEPDADVVLTERELRLPPSLAEENTGLSLLLTWSGMDPSSPGEAAWLDRAKLESLGFDCRLPSEASSAVAHYGRVPPREVVLVLEFDPDRKEPSATRLFVVDAGLDPVDLRRRYPDRSRYVVARGIMRVFAAPGSGEELRGQVVSLLIREIHVPRSQRSLLDSLITRNRDAKDSAGSAAAHAAGKIAAGPPLGPPRYKVRVRWGRRLEPWIESVEPL